MTDPTSELPPGSVETDCTHCGATITFEAGPGENWLGDEYELVSVGDQDEYSMGAEAKKRCSRCGRLHMVVRKTE